MFIRASHWSILSARWIWHPHTILHYDPYWHEASYSTQLMECRYRTCESIETYLEGTDTKVILRSSKLHGSTDIWVRSRYVREILPTKRQQKQFAFDAAALHARERRKLLQGPRSSPCKGHTIRPLMKANVAATSAGESHTNLLHRTFTLTQTWNIEWNVSHPKEQAFMIRDLNHTLMGTVKKRSL
jgi:hypothetical protein